MNTFVQFDIAIRNMEIEQINNTYKGRFQASENGLRAGEMEYTWAGLDKLIINHTEVSPDFSGRGVGKLLLKELVQFARKKQIKVMPLCPYAKSVFDKTPDIHDVLF